MIQLTINHLAPYLPHNLQITDKRTGSFYELVFDCRWVDGLINPHTLIILTAQGTHKIILRPMSDLIKEITHRGETFAPLKELSNNTQHVFKNSDLFLLITPKGGSNVDLLPTWITNKLHEWMFDTAGLIESGFAINVNTLEINPYETP